MEHIFASIITIGDELLIGQVVDTNSSYIARELNTAGVAVKSRVAVGDNYDDIFKALETESLYAQIVIITGGLGPTKDDITKAALCNYFKGTLILDERALENVKYRFESIYKKPMGEMNRSQGYVPDVCTVIQNSRGTAPGMIFEKEEVIYISMPGVPYEMEGMLQEVIPFLQSRFTLPKIVHKNILTAGIGESALAEKIAQFEDTLPLDIKLAYLPSFGMVRLRLSTVSHDRQMLDKIEELHKQLSQLILPYVVTDEDETLPEVVGRLLSQRNRTISTAESCTGGSIAGLLTSVPGASAWFEGSVVSYSNDVKQLLLRVKADTLQDCGAVSENTVIEMVAGALQLMKTDFALAVSGIMGPAGGSAEKPVGTVWIAVGNQHKTRTRKAQLRYNRGKNVEVTCTLALNFLREFILEMES